MAAWRSTTDWNTLCQRLSLSLSRVSSRDYQRLKAALD